MSKAAFAESVKQRGINILLNEPMARHTTFKIGGAADMFIAPASEDELLFCINAAREADVPFFVCGNGSNLLVSDNGIEGAVICLENIKGIEISGNTATVKAGTAVMAMCTALMRAGLAGFEFAFGIPGTVGGAVYMNAGAYGGEVSQSIISARYLDKSGEIKEISKDDMHLCYRGSIFRENGGIILSATFAFYEDNSESIFERMSDYMARRQAKQPLDMPSAGSVFKRPEGNFAGTLIEKSGLKGERVGAAEVSCKHAGFIVNTGGASSADVTALIKRIKSKVYVDSGIKLQTEVIYIGR